jgi:hypothetical protein
MTSFEPHFWRFEKRPALPNRSPNYAAADAAFYQGYDPLFSGAMSIPSTIFGKAGIQVSVIAQGGARMDLHQVFRPRRRMSAGYMT